MSSRSALPALSIVNRQRRVHLDLAEIEKRAREALPACRRSAGRSRPVLAQLEEVEIALVSDQVIARVHRRFLHVPGATDVITFTHGELIVSVTTAMRRAQELGEIIEREVLRYIVHGVLHLNGHEDTEVADAARMWRAQERVLHGIWPSKPR